MKTMTSLLTGTILLAGVATASADQQRSDESVGYALSQQASHASTVDGGAYAATRHPRGVAAKPRAKVHARPNAE